MLENTFNDIEKQQFKRDLKVIDQYRWERLLANAKYNVQLVLAEFINKKETPPNELLQAWGWLVKEMEVLKNDH